jgi:hypothetical protein
MNHYWSDWPGFSRAVLLYRRPAPLAAVSQKSAGTFATACKDSASNVEVNAPTKLRALVPISLEYQRVSLGARNLAAGKPAKCARRLSITINVRLPLFTARISPAARRR